MVIGHRAWSPDCRCCFKVLGRTLGGNEALWAFRWRDCAVTEAGWKENLCPPCPRRDLLSTAHGTKGRDGSLWLAGSHLCFLDMSVLFCFLYVCFVRKNRKNNAVGFKVKILSTSVFSFAKNESCSDFMECSFDLTRVNMSYLQHWLKKHLINFRVIQNTISIIFLAKWSYQNIYWIWCIS